MKLERIKCKELEPAKSVCLSKSYMVGCTGQKAVILDRERNLIHKVTGLNYVYAAEISPDESKLLLISNLNLFYVVDLRTFEKTRISLRAPYKNNLDGKGCWSFDGKFLWIPLYHINSTLRRYCAEDLTQYEDFLADKFFIQGISKLDDEKTYFMTAYNRREENRSYFITYDGEEFREFPLENPKHVLETSTTVDPKRGLVTLVAIEGCYQYTLEGKGLRKITHPAPKDKVLCASDVFGPLFAGDSEKQEKVRELSTEHGLEHIPAPDRITKYAVSSCGTYIYLASDSGFYLLDVATEQVLATVPERFGVHQVAELAPDLLALSTWNGTKLYRICR